eukprot:UN34423
MQAKKMKPQLSQFPGDYLGGFYKLDMADEKSKYLGKGAYGIVAHGVATTKNPRIKQGTQVAIKKQEKIFDNVVGAKRLLRELRVLRVLNGHSSVVKLLDVKLPPGEKISNFNTILMVFEYIDWDLQKLIKSETFLAERQIKAITKRILYGLKYMHSANLVHRDLKPANILLNSRVEVKVCDFGLARCVTESTTIPVGKSAEIIETQKKQLNMPSDKSDLKPLPFRKKITSHVVTRYYRAPEICVKSARREELFAVDMWSVGCILGELLQMLKGNCPDCNRRQILIPGVSDDLLSPGLNSRDIFKTPGKRSGDQINEMIKLLGNPPQSFIDRVKHKETQKYL